MALALVDATSSEDDSFVQLPIRVLKNHDLSFGARLTYAALSSFAWQSDECWPSQETLAETLGTSKRSIVRYIQELVDAGLIERMRPKHQASRYRFLIRGASAKPSLADESKCQITSEQVPNFHLASAKLAHEVYTEKKTQEEYPLTNARARKIDEPIRRVIAAFGMTEAPWSVNAISERLARYEETYPGLDAVAEAEAMRSESDAEGRKAGNWLARWDGWMRTASQRQERIRQTAPPQSTPPPVINPNVPLDFASVPAELMPDAHRDVPHYMDLMDKALRWYVEEKGKTQWPHQYGVFRCAPAKEQCDAGRMVLVTNEPPEAADEMEQFVRILARGFDVRVESRWAS